MNQAKLTLISFPTCPFVQRAIIALKEKQVDFEIVYIDLADKPDWFMKISPLGKVPLLKVAREGKPEAVLFESAVILEYLEETTAGTKLHPSDPVDRALHRAWMEYGSNVLGDFAKWTTEKDAKNLPALRKTLHDKLARLENAVTGPFFAGENFSHVDVVFAPIFMRMNLLETKVQDAITAEFVNITAWRNALLARASVLQSVPDDIAERYIARLGKYESALLKAA